MERLESIVKSDMKELLFDEKTIKDNHNPWFWYTGITVKYTIRKTTNDCNIEFLMYDVSVAPVKFP